MASLPGGRALPALHVVTDDRVLADRGFPGVAGALLEIGAGGLALHIRGPGTEGGALLALAERLAPLAAASGSLLVVNDRVDVALAAGLDAVHLGRRSLPVAVVRDLVGAGMGIGASVHDAAEAVEASGEGADWLVVGSVYPTRSHPGREGQGTALLRRVAEEAPSLPMVAIGGITPARIPEVLRAGAHGVAVLGGVWDAVDPGRALGEYLQGLAEAAGRGEEEP